jgi:beta-glucanase (GH16 family)
VNSLSSTAVCAFFALSASPCIAAQQTPLPPAGVPAGWKLVWADEFDKPGLPDVTKWEYDTSLNRKGWNNDEKQYYSGGRARNSRVADGKLLITARREQLKKARDYGGQRYTSARLSTRDLYAFTYGYVEVRAKLPCGLGTWPAIWTLGISGEWPEMGEIDIMEHVGRDKGNVIGCFHTGAYNWTKYTQVRTDTRVESVCDDFHTYQMTWTRDRILIGVDGRNYAVLENAKDGDVQKWPFDKPQYLILNVAIGGGFAGPVNNRIFPVTMEVDYVRIYKP